MLIIKNGKFKMTFENNIYVIYRNKSKIQTIINKTEEEALMIFNKWYSK